MGSGEMIAWALALVGAGLAAFISYDISRREASGVMRELKRCGLQPFWYTEGMQQAISHFASLGNGKNRRLSHCYSGIFNDLETYLCRVTGDCDENPRATLAHQVILHIAGRALPDLTIYRNGLDDQLIHRLHALNFTTRLDDFSVASSVDDPLFVRQLETIARSLIRPGCNGMEVKNNQILYFGGAGDEQFKSHYIQASLQARAQITEQLLSAAEKYDERIKRHKHFYSSP